MSSQTKDEKYYYPFIRDWLEKSGIKSVVSEEVGITIPTGPYFPRITIQPDILGLKVELFRASIVAVEVKINPDRIYEGIGQCAIYQIMADLVYLALPRKISRFIRNPSIFNHLRIGLLEFSEEETARTRKIEVIVNEKIKPQESQVKDYSHFSPQLSRMLEDCFK